jgi:adenylosuccinate lyase
VIAFPRIDWLTEMDNFVAGLGLEREQWTTQISNYDNLAALCDAVARINVILMDLCKGKLSFCLKL